MTEIYAPTPRYNFDSETLLESYRTYDAVERAIDHLSDEGFPVEYLRVVGQGVTTVEQVEGRMTTARSTAKGAGVGVWTGLAVRTSTRRFPPGRHRHRPHPRRYRIRRALGWCTRSSRPIRHGRSARLRLPQEHRGHPIRPDGGAGFRWRSTGKTRAAMTPSPLEYALSPRQARVEMGIIRIWPVQRRTLHRSCRSVLQ